MDKGIAFCRFAGVNKYVYHYCLDFSIANESCLTLIINSFQYVETPVWRLCDKNENKLLYTN